MRGFWGSSVVVVHSVSLSDTERLYGPYSPLRKEPGNRMTLPVIPIPRSTISLAGVDIDYRALSRTEATSLPTYKDKQTEAEHYVIACSLGMNIEEVAEWCAQSDSKEVGRLVDAILTLSGLA